MPKKIMYFPLVHPINNVLDTAYQATSIFDFQLLYNFLIENRNPIGQVVKNLSEKEKREKELSYRRLQFSDSVEEAIKTANEHR